MAAWKSMRVRIVLRAPAVEHRRQVAAAAEPASCRSRPCACSCARPGTCGFHGWAISEMPRGPEAGVVLGARHLRWRTRARTRRGRSRRGRRPSRRRGRASSHITPPPPARRLIARPGLALEAAGGRSRVRALHLVLDRLELGADAVAQVAEPGRGFGLLVVDVGGAGVMSSACETVGLAERFA